MLNLVFNNYSANFIKKCDKILQDRILEKLKKLQNEPFPSDCKRVEGLKEKTFRVRVGHYRILYAVFQEKNEIFISKIEKRSKVYD